DAHVMFYLIADTAPDNPPPQDLPNEDIMLATAMPSLKIALGQPAPERPRDMSVAAALPRRSSELSCPLVDVLLDGRFLCQVNLPHLKLPMVARVGLSTQEHILPWHGLAPGGVLCVSAGVHEAAHALALELLRLKADSSAPEPFHSDLHLLRLVY